MNTNFEIIRIAGLIAKKIQGEISVEEEFQLERWLNDNPENISTYNKLCDPEYREKLIQGRRKYDTKSAGLKVFEQYNKSKQRKRLVRIVRVAAAIFLPLLMSVFYFTIDGSEDYIAEIAPEKPKATLVLADGSKIDLLKNSNKNINVNNKIFASNSGNKLIYRKSKRKHNNTTVISNNKLSFNSIVTPEKGEYMVQLDDGTKVWLNSMSTLRYPVAFVGKKRNVYLDGEAYFEVAHNTKMPFIVNLKSDVGVEVLGTSFNVKSIKSEDGIQTTLVEGSVRLNKADKELTLLKPGQQANYSVKHNKMEVSEVRTEIITAWKDGLYLFRDERLEDIMVNISKWYDIEVEFINQSLKEIRFSGSLSKEDKLLETLEMFEKTNKLKFKADGKTIVFTKK